LRPPAFGSADDAHGQSRIASGNLHIERRARPAAQLGARGKAASAHAVLHQHGQLTRPPRRARCRRRALAGSRRH
jgi:hypothetical protein